MTTQSFPYSRPGAMLNIPRAAAPVGRQRITSAMFLHFAGIWCLTLCFMAVWPSDALSTGMNPSRLIELGLLFAGTTMIGLYSASHQSWKLRLDRTGLWIIGLFCTWAFLSGIWGVSRFLAIGKSIELSMVTFAMTMAGCWAACYLPSRKSLPTIAALAMVTVILLLVAYNVPIHGTPYAVPETANRKRLILGYSHPLEGADLIALALISLFACGLRFRTKALFVPIIGLLFALTQPRGALGGVVAAIIAMILVRIQRADRRAIVFGGIVLLFAATLMFIGPDLPKVMDILIPDDADSLNGRTELWEYATELIRERPILGHGYYSSRFMLLELFSWAGHTHNAYLEVALSLGIPGLILMIAFIGHVIRVTMRTRDTWLAGVAGYCFSVSFLDPLIMTPSISMGILILATMHAGAREIEQRAQTLPLARPNYYAGFDPVQTHAAG